MKKWLWIFGVAAFCGLATISRGAQESAVGLAYQQIDEMEGIQLKYDWMFSEHFGLEGRISYFSGDMMTDVEYQNDEYYQGQLFYSYTLSGKATVPMDAIPLEIALKAVFPTEKINFYILAGGGYYTYDNNSGDTTTENVFGYFGAAGFEIRLIEQLSLFADVEYVKATWESHEETVYNQLAYYGPLEGKVYENHQYETIEGGFDDAGLTVGLLWKF